MNITVIYASGRKTRSSTYQIAQMLIKELLEDGTCFSFFLPDDMPHICTGCRACILGKEQACKGAAAMAPILEAMEQSELILFCAPTYVYHVPGQMKSLLDHLAYRWMVHRPDLSFMKKQAVIINTAGRRRHALHRPRYQRQYRKPGVCENPLHFPKRMGLRLE